MNIKSIVEEPLKEIWQEEIFHEFCQYPPMSVSSLPENAILFIGLNPSLSEKQKQILSANQCQQLVFYDTSIEKHSYFNKFKEIGNHLNCNWGHFDLLFLQETKQNKVAELEKRSVLEWVDELPVDVPVLLMHGTNDKRVHVSHSKELAEALEKRNIPHKLVLFEGDNHTLVQNKEQSNKELVNWFHKHL